jgi:hypothetical protein
VGMPMPEKGLEYLPTDINELEIFPFIWDVAITIK